MGFDQQQRKALRAKLRHANIRSRVQNGTTLHYIEGWWVVAEANRIFGHENWDRETRPPTCIWSDRHRGQVACLYSSQVRITVRAGDTVVTRDGLGTGFGRGASPESAHEIAMKAAETDATKRALATFGNPFGLALYDKDMRQVTQPTTRDQDRNTRSAQAGAPKVILTGRAGQQFNLSGTRDLVETVAKILPELETIEAVYAFWEANLTTFASLLECEPNTSRAPIDAVTAKLKARLRDLGGRTLDDGCVVPPASATPRQHDNSPGSSTNGNAPTPLARAKERRVRDRHHLAFVARHPCLICGRRPAQAHHVRFAQPRAMAMKVSDEYTVPLCVGHHDAVHRTGDEPAWWATRKLDPLAIALQLWTATDKSAESPALEPPAFVDIKASDCDVVRWPDVSDRM